MQAIGLLLGTSGTRNARLVSKPWAMMLGQAFRTGRLKLPSCGKVDAATIKRVQRFFGALCQLTTVELVFESEPLPVVNLVDPIDPPGEDFTQMQAWATQLSHAALSNAISRSDSVRKLTVHAPDMLPLICYLTLSQLRSLDVSSSKVPHKQLQLIPQSLTQLTELVLTMGIPQHGTGVEASDIAPLSQLSSLQRLELNSDKQAMTTPGTRHSAAGRLRALA
jgi:hypothetical protein